MVRCLGGNVGVVLARKAVLDVINEGHGEVG